MSDNTMKALYVKEILENHSNEYNPLTQDDICIYMEEEYGVTAERKSIGRVLNSLRYHGLDIRGNKGVWLAKDDGLGDEELLFIYDSLLFNEAIPLDKSNAIISKLSKMAKSHFQMDNRHLVAMERTDRTSDAENLYQTIQIINAAIDGDYCVYYCRDRRSMDGKSIIKCESYFKPYLLTISNNKYYVVCDENLSDNIKYLDISKIYDVKPLTEELKDKYYANNPIAKMHEDDMKMIDPLINKDAYNAFRTKIKRSDAIDFILKHPYISENLNHKAAEWIDIICYNLDIDIIYDVFGHGSDHVFIKGPKYPDDPLMIVSIKTTVEDLVRFKANTQISMAVYSPQYAVKEYQEMIDEMLKDQNILETLWDSPEEDD